MEETAKRVILFSTKTAIKDKTNVFTLGDRVHVLTDPEPNIIIPYLAEEKNMVVLLFFLSFYSFT